jgi:hypothetical protein
MIKMALDLTDYPHSSVEASSTTRRAYYCKVGTRNILIVPMFLVDEGPPEAEEIARRAEVKALRSTSDYMLAVVPKVTRKPEVALDGASRVIMYPNLVTELSRLASSNGEGSNDTYSATFHEHTTPQLARVRSPDPCR